MPPVSFFVLNESLAAADADKVMKRIKHSASIDVDGSRASILRAISCARLDAMTGGGSNQKVTRRLREVIVAFVDQVLSRTRFPGGLFILRTHLPSPTFDDGRWHADGTYFASKSCHVKYAATFVGPGTLFKEGQPGAAQGARWLAGCEDATIHSEPPFSMPRLFCSLLPCTLEQCAERRRFNRERTAERAAKRRA
jgi:hypothetical protein